MKKKKKIFVSGKFNVLHSGHIRLLRFAKELGDYLIVGVEGDKITDEAFVAESLRLEAVRTKHLYTMNQLKQLLKK